MAQSGQPMVSKNNQFPSSVSFTPEMEENHNVTPQNGGLSPQIQRADNRYQMTQCAERVTVNALKH